MDLATKTGLKCGNSEMVIQENLPCSCLLLNGNDASLFPYLEASCPLGPGVAAIQAWHHAGCGRRDGDARGLDHGGRARWRMSQRDGGVGTWKSFPGNKKMGFLACPSSRGGSRTSHE